MMPNRRQFLIGSVSSSLSAVAIDAQPGRRYLILTADSRSYRLALARRELLRGLTRLRLAGEVRLAGPEEPARTTDVRFVFRIEPERFRNPEAYSISAQAGTVAFTAPAEQAALYAVFDFLERQGAFFGVDGESYPLESSGKLQLPVEGRPWEASPQFAVRGLLPWPSFLSCITIFNEEDFRAYFEGMLRMRLNTFGMHVYSEGQQDTEAYLSFEFAGVGHSSFLSDTATNYWSYLPQRTSQYAMGSSQYYDSEVFGADAMRLARGQWEIADHTREMLRKAFAYARRLGIRTGIGFELSGIPSEILRALPPEARGQDRLLDLESVTAKKLLEARLAQLLDAYPDVDYVWIWEDEKSTWESRRRGIPLSTTPFLQAHDFLRRNAPGKRMVLSGWGGVTRNFDDLHKRLPKDIIFAGLLDSHGGDPVHESFARLDDRERWPIPWLEEDGGNWQPQFEAYRLEMNMKRALRFGCQGMLGLHWRHRIIDPNAGFLARRGWDGELSPEQYYHAYARANAASGRAGNLGRILDDMDHNRRIMSTYTERFKDGHQVLEQFSPDSAEGFVYYETRVPSAAKIQSQREVASALRELAASASTETERERLSYLAGNVEFVVPYSEAWTIAQQLNRVLGKAAALKKNGDGAEARNVVVAEGVPLWLRLAPEVRRAVLILQRIVANRSDLGTLASIQHKFVRLALVRLRLSMQEYLGELPPETENMFAEVTRPDTETPTRIIVPTRPSLLGKDEKVRIMIVAPGKDAVRAVTLHIRLRGMAGWNAIPANLMGRRTYQALIGPFDPKAQLAEYYVSATAGRKEVVAPADAPQNSYLLTLA